MIKYHTIPYIYLRTPPTLRPYIQCRPTYTYMCTCTHRSCMHTRAHTCMHTYTYACVLSSSALLFLCFGNAWRLSDLFAPWIGSASESATGTIQMFNYNYNSN